MDVSEVGEFALIERLREALGDGRGEAMIAGIGDDAAVWRTSPFAVATTDTLVAGVHVLPGRVAWRDIGWKALAVNLSDIAAMGAAPSVALVTLMLPRGMPVADADALYAGLAECAATYGVTVAGGDVVSAPVFGITVALYGEARSGADGCPLLLRRGAARRGDVIAVTGALGASAAGLRQLLAGGPHPDPALLERHARPRPRLDAGAAALDAGVRCAIDISDGLVQDVGHVCEASGVAAELRLPAIPVDLAAKLAFRDEAVSLAATGGEDYELALIGSPERLAATGDRLGAPLVVVGRIVEGAGVRCIDASGAEVAFAEGGYEHLRPRRA